MMSWANNKKMLIKGGLQSPHLNPIPGSREQTVVQGSNEKQINWMIIKQFIRFISLIKDLMKLYYLYLTVHMFAKAPHMGFTATI